MSLAKQDKISQSGEEEREAIGGGRCDLRSPFWSRWGCVSCKGWPNLRSAAGEAKDLVCGREGERGGGREAGRAQAVRGQARTQGFMDKKKKPPC